MSLQKPILRWRDPDLDLNAIADADHRRELADKAAAIDLETFKKEIEKHVRSSLVKPVAHETEGDYFVLVNANEDDMEVADNISDKLDENHLGYYVATESIDELSEEDDYDALMVVYGSCSSSWVTEQVRLCRRVMLKKKLNPPVCTVYFGPPDEKERLHASRPRCSSSATRMGLRWNGSSPPFGRGGRKGERSRR